VKVLPERELRIEYVPSSIEIDYPYCATKAAPKMF